MKPAAALALALLVAACAGPAPSSPPGPTASPIATPTAAPTPTEAPLPTAAPTPTAPTATAVCVPFTGNVPSGLGGDPCPAAIAAVRRAVASLGTIRRIVLEPNPFSCGDLWPGVTSPVPICFGPIVINGTAMHGWVSFAGSDKVAAVGLHRNPTAPGASERPGPTGAAASPWTVTILAFAVPPAAWSMP